MTKPHPDESKWMPYATAIFAHAAGGRREEYQLEALLAVRSALHSIPDAARHKARIAKACRWRATDLVRARYRRDRMERAWIEGTHTSEGHAPGEAGEASAARGLLASVHPAVLRHLVGDMSGKVAAECVGVTPAAIRHQVYRMREKHRAA